MYLLTKTLPLLLALTAAPALAAEADEHAAHHPQGAAAASAPAQAAPPTAPIPGGAPAPGCPMMPGMAGMGMGMGGMAATESTGRMGGMGGMPPGIGAGASPSGRAAPPPAAQGGQMMMQGHAMHCMGQTAQDHAPQAPPTRAPAPVPRR